MKNVTVYVKFIYNFYGIVFRGMYIIRYREIIYLRSFLEKRNGDTSDVLFFFSK